MLKVNHLKLKYQQKTIFDNLSFQLAANETIVFLGSSGLGKTSLLNVIAGLIPPSGGTIINKAKQMGYLNQNDNLLPWLTVEENLRLPFQLKNIALSATIKEQICHVLQQVKLSYALNLYPNQLSGGMKKRVELARALLFEPDLLLFDEPFASLDEITKEELLLLCQQLCQEQHLSLLLVTHSFEEATFLADKIFLFGNTPASIVRVVINQHKYQPITSYANSTATELHNLFIDQRTTDTDKIIAKSNTNKTSLNRWQLIKNGLFLVLFLTFFIGALTLVKKIMGIEDYLLPAPIAVIKLFLATIEDLSIFYHLKITIAESLLGFLMAFGLALPLAYFLHHFKPLQLMFLPIFISLNTIPVIALAPFLVLWLGFGLFSKIITVLLTVFFPLFINSFEAFNSAAKRTYFFKKFFSPTLPQYLTHLMLPAALPGIINGIKIALTTSIIGSVVGEFISGQAGLGNLITISHANFDTTLMFVALIWLIILGLVYYYTISILQQTILAKYYETEKY